MQQRNNHKLGRRSEALKIGSTSSNSKWGFTQIRNEAFIIPNSKWGLTQIRNEAKVAKFGTLGKPKAWAIQEPKSSTNSRIYESLKPIATRFDSIKFVPLTRSFLASQIRVFDVSLSSPEAATASVRMSHPFIRSWLLLVTKHAIMWTAL